MIEMQTTCRTCGIAHTPDHADYVAGRWHICSACRDRAERLADLADAPPVPLPRHRDRDGPVKDHRPFTTPRRDHGAHSTAPAHSWNWKSKG